VITDVTLEKVNCWCGTPFALPELLLKSARTAGHKIYCPHGHAIVWKETEADKLRRERDRLKQEQARLIEERDAAQRSENEQWQRANKAEAATKRLKKRTSAGTCPCCSRTFSNMAEHMKHQHPEFVADGGAKVLPIKRKA
jgi:hypothetical protein